MLADRQLELPPASLDPTTGLEADLPDLLVAPRFDATHVVVRALLERGQLGRRPDADLLDLRRLLLAHAGVDPLALLGGRGLHRAGDLGQEDGDARLPASRARDGVVAFLRTITGCRLDGSSLVRRLGGRGRLSGFVLGVVHPSYLEGGPNVLHRRARNNRVEPKTGASGNHARGVAISRT